MRVSIFITATDTDAGKTFVTAALSRALVGRGLNVGAFTPVCCGRISGQMNPDIKALLRAQGMGDTQTDAVNLYDFAASAAPGQAAAKEGRRIEPESLVSWCAARARAHDIALIEGVGGLMVPLTERFLVSDWLCAMPNSIVVLIVRARLGGINHALLSLDKLHSMGREPVWVVINDADNTGGQMLRRHAEAIAPRLKSGTRLLSLSHQPDVTHAVIASQLQPLLADITQRAHRNNSGRLKGKDCINAARE